LDSISLLDPMDPKRSLGFRLEVPESNGAP
jgi:hypothetical protein